MTSASLIFIFAFTSNIILGFLAGLGELFLFPKKRHIFSGMKELWLKKVLFLFLWGTIAKIVNIVVPVSSFFLPLFILFFLIIRAFTIACANKKHAKKIAVEMDRIITDPVLIIPILITGYIDINIPVLLVIFLGICLGIGFATLIILSIRNRIELERQRNIFVLLLSTGFIVMIITALRQTILV